MAKFCRSCGAQLQDGDLVCPSCGRKVQEASAPEAAQTPAEENAFNGAEIWGKVSSATKVAAGKTADAVKKIDTRKIVSNYKKVLPIIVIVMAVFCLVISILNLFSTYDVRAWASFGDETDSQIVSIREAFESDNFVAVHVFNIIYGILNLAMVALFITPFFKALTKVAIVRKLFDNYAVIGLGMNVVYLILFAICGRDSDKFLGQTISYALAAHWTSWVAAVLFALLFTVSVVLPRINKKPAPQFQVPQEPRQ